MGAKKRALIVLVIAGVFVLAGALVFLTRACGGDEPAPGEAVTITGTVNRVATAKTTYAGDIRSIDWKAEVGARPMERDVEEVLYSYLTEDDSEEAIVLVRMEGSGAYLDYYDYTFRDGQPVLLFSQSGIKGGKVEPGTRQGAFVEVSPAPLPGDPECCPGNLRYTTYKWSAEKQNFEAESVEIRPNQ